MSEDGSAVTIRRAGPTDAAETAEVWLASFHATYDFPLAHSDDQVRHWIRNLMQSESETWVVEEDGRIVGMMVLEDAMLDQLYLHPQHWRHGIGSRLVALAKERRPGGLDLYTFQENTAARAFYEHHGFAVVDLNDGSRNEEHQPDVRYAWRPGPDAG